MENGEKREEKNMRRKGDNDEREKAKERKRGGKKKKKKMWEDLRKENQKKSPSCLSQSNQSNQFSLSIKPNQTAPSKFNSRISFHYSKNLTTSIIFWGEEKNISCPQSICFFGFILCCTVQYLISCLLFAAFVPPVRSKTLLLLSKICKK